MPTVSKNGRVLGRPVIGTKQHHLCISIYPSLWDRIKYVSADSGKTTSRYIADKVVEYIKQHGEEPPVVPEKEDNLKGIEHHVLKPLSFEENAFNLIKLTSKKAGVPTSRYIRNIILYY